MFYAEGSSQNMHISCCTCTCIIYMKFLGHEVCIHSNLVENAKQLSKVTVSIYTLAVYESMRLSISGFSYP